MALQLTALVIGLMLVLVGPVTAATINVSNAAALQSALNTAGAGDHIVLANGTYVGRFTITNNSGTASQRITVRAANRHQAILVGTGGLGNSANIGLDISRPYWIIDGLQLRDHFLGIRMRTSSGHHIELQNNLIYNFGSRGIEADTNAADNVIRRNVIAFSPALAGFRAEAGILIWASAHRTTIERNLVYSITNNGHQCGDAGGCSVGDKRGYPLQISQSSDNVIRGNLFMDGAKGTVRVFSVPSHSLPTNNNHLSDNIVAFSEGAGIALSDDKSSFNTVKNNIFYSTYFAAWTAKGNTPGENTFDHNTTIVTPFARRGNRLDRADDGSSSRNTIVRNNLMYGTDANAGSQYLWDVDSWSSAVASSRNNLFWRPGSMSGWLRNVVLHGTDIVSQPTFTSLATGDVSLAAGSPGTQAAFDGTDIGIQFNELLNKQWMANLLALPTAQTSPGGQSTSFSTSAAHRYQVYVYIPDSVSFSGINTFTIEGTQIQRDYGNIVSRGYVGGPPQRWIYLGTHANDGTLNVNWSAANSVTSIFIRQLPTVDEAYTWLDQVPGIEVPGKLVGEWRFNEATGTTVADLSTTGNAGTLVDVDWDETQKIEGEAAASFSVPANFIRVPTHEWSLNTFTVETWVRLHDPVPDVERIIFGHTSLPRFANRIQIKTAPHSATNTGAWVRVGLASEGNAAIDIAEMAPETWTSVALRYDRGAYTVFMDGIPRASGAVTHNFTVLNTVAHLGNWGYEPITEGVGLTRSFIGHIDSTRMWSRALTNEEVLANYNAEKPGEPIDPPPDTFDPLVLVSCIVQGNGLTTICETNPGTANPPDPAACQFPNHFVVSYDGAQQPTPQGCSIVGKTLTLTMATPPASGQVTVEVCYAPL